MRYARSLTGSGLLLHTGGLPGSGRAQYKNGPTARKSIADKGPVASNGSGPACGIDVRRAIATRAGYPPTVGDVGPARHPARSRDGTGSAAYRSADRCVQVLAPGMRGPLAAATAATHSSRLSWSWFT